TRTGRRTRATRSRKRSRSSRTTDGTTTARPARGRSSATRPTASSRSASGKARRTRRTAGARTPHRAGADMAAHTGRPAGIRGDAAPGPVSATPKWAGLAWALLILNTLGSTGAKTVLPLPRSVSQLVTMGSLMTAFVIALVLN